MWSEKCQDAFEQLKEVLCTAQVIAYQDPAEPMMLDTDASGVDAGAVLSQRDARGKERVLGNASWALTKLEQNYFVTRRELFRRVWKFPAYLAGARFTIRTDHSALRWL